MRPYLHLRRWWRRTSHGNRTATSIAILAAVALVAWMFTPTGDGTPSASSATTGSVTSDSPAATDSATAGAVDAAPGDASAETPAGGDAPTAAQTAANTAGSRPGGVTPACLQPPKGTPGVTADTITVAAAIVDLAGPIGNSAAGLGSSDEIASMADAVAKDINGRGGIQCRKVVVKSYKVNPLSADSQHSACLQIAEDKPFIAIDVGGFSTNNTYGCLPQQRVPVVDTGGALPSEIDRFAPYFASATADLATLMRTLANGLRVTGWFDSARGFKKLGLLYEDCIPQANAFLDAALASMGITSSQISKYTFSCPGNGFASPSEMSQAVTQHKLAGVTHVIPITGTGSLNIYTNLAERQDFHPTYGVSDYAGLPITQSGPLAASGSAENFDGATLITLTRYGQERTPGMPVDPGTARCQRVLKSGGLDPSWAGQKGGGLVCTLLWAVEAAVAHAPALTREAALTGLFSAGTVQFAFPFADATYRAPRKFSGGDSWWPAQWHKDCGCFRVVDPQRRPSFS